MAAQVIEKVIGGVVVVGAGAFVAAIGSWFYYDQPSNRVPSGSELHDSILRNSKWTWAGVASFGKDHFPGGHTFERSEYRKYKLDDAIAGAVSNPEGAGLPRVMQGGVNRSCVVARRFFETTPFPGAEDINGRANYIRRAMATAHCKNFQYTRVRDIRHELYDKLDLSTAPAGDAWSTENTPAFLAKLAIQSTVDAATASVLRNLKV